MSIVLVDAASKNPHFRTHGVEKMPVYFVYHVGIDGGGETDFLIQADFFSGENEDHMDRSLTILCPMCRIRRIMENVTVGGYVVPQPVWDEAKFYLDDEAEVPNAMETVIGKFRVQNKAKDWDVVLDTITVAGHQLGPIVTGSSNETWTCPDCVDYAAMSGDDTHVFCIRFVRPGAAVSVPGCRVWPKKAVVM